MFRGYSNALTNLNLYNIVQNHFNHLTVTLLQKMLEIGNVSKNTNSNTQRNFLCIAFSNHYAEM